MRDLDSFSTSFPQMSLPFVSHESESPECFECVFRMSREGKIDAECEAARILCDITLDINLQQALVDRGGLTVLKNLIQNSPCMWTKQHAIIAVSNLSDAMIFQNAIIKEGFLPLLLKLACDGPFETAELRRSAMHILFNLCNNPSPEVSKYIKEVKKEISLWMSSIDNLHDEKLKFHAVRARECLSRVVFAS